MEGDILLRSDTRYRICTFFSNYFVPLILLAIFPFFPSFLLFSLQGGPSCIRFGNLPQAWVLGIHFIPSCRSRFTQLVTFLGEI